MDIGCSCPLKTLSCAYSNYFNNILPQHKAIRTTGALCFASKNEGIQQIIFLDKKCFNIYPEMMHLCLSLLGTTVSMNAQVFAFKLRPTKSWY